MFCGECGAKNENGAKFCENCGSPVVIDEEKDTKPSTEEVQETDSNIEEVKPEKTEPKKQNKTKKTSKKTKAFIISSVVIFVLLLGSYFTLRFLTDPGKLAKEYFNAMADFNVDKIYDFIEVEKSPFTTKELFKKLMNEENKKVEIVNSKITDKKLSSNGLTMSVTISYITKEDNESDEFTINLIKSKNKKWLIFDDWKIQGNSLETTSGSELKVVKDSKITIEGIELDKKYLDSSKSNDKMDVYKLPAMFQTTYMVTAVLPFGMNIEDELNVSSYTKTYTLELTKDQLSEETKGKINETTKKALETFYKGIIENKAFADIKSSFEHKNIDLKDLETTYQKLNTTLMNSSSKLTLFTVSSIEVRDLEISEDGKLEFSFKINYNYTVTYEDYDGSSKTNESKDYEYIDATFVFEDNAFHLTNIDDLPDYFSKYY